MFLLGPRTPQRCSGFFSERHESIRESELCAQHNLRPLGTPSVADSAPSHPSTAELGFSCKGGSNGNQWQSVSNSPPLQSDPSSLKSG